MKLLAGLILCAVLFAVPAAALDVVKFDASLYTGTAGGTKVTTVEFDVATLDTISFSRHAIKYDESYITLTAIVNGADAPSYSMDPFINWAGSGDADVIWLGQFFNIGGDESPWEGEAFDLTWSLDSATPRSDTKVEWTEMGSCNVNYIEVNSVPCNDTVRRRTKCCSGTQCGSGAGNCIITNTFLETKFRVFAMPSSRGNGKDLGPGPVVTPAKAAFNERQEARIAALSPKMREFVRAALRGDDVTREEYLTAASENKTWGEAKELYK